MKKSTDESNQARKDAGFQIVQLIGWARPAPVRLRGPQDGVGERARLRGRRRSHAQLRRAGARPRRGTLHERRGLDGPDGWVQAGHAVPLKLAEFNDGYRYDQYNASTDRLAAYGPGALVAGGVAAKMGLFAKLLAFIVAFKKIFIVGGVAAVGLLAKRFKGQSKDAPAA
jgi:hypothetical protein